MGVSDNIMTWWPAWWPARVAEQVAALSGYIMPSLAECVRDQIALIVTTELVKQKVIADDLILNHPLTPEGIQAQEDIDNGVWDILDNIFLEKGTHFMQTQMPGLNIFFGSSPYPKTQGNNISTQSTDTSYMITVHAESKHEQKAGVINKGDEKSAKLVARIVFILRTIIMSGPYVRLGFDKKLGLIGKRWINQADVFQPDYQESDGRHGILGIINISVDFDELALNLEGTELLEIMTQIKVKLKTEDNGKIININ